MSQLSSKQKEKLSAAIEKTMDFCSEGYAPNDAIIKTAKALKLTPDHLPVLVNAYNAGATAEHWSSGSSVREKTASFPIADLDTIKKTLYPKQVKKASYTTKVEDNTFSLSPSAIYGDRLFDCYKDKLPALTKSASAPTEREHTLVNRKLRDTVKLAAKRSRELFGQSEIDLDWTLNRLSQVVRKHDMPDFDELYKTASAVFGRPGEEIMTCLAEVHPEVLRKKLYTKTAALQVNHPFYKELKTAIKQVSVCAKAKNVKEAVDKKCAKAEKILEDSWKTTLYGDEIERTILPPIYDIPAKKKELKKKAFREDLDVVRPLSQLEVMNHPDWQGTTEREYGILSALADAEHEARLRRIATESIFTDLINTDDFLRDQDPEEVLEAYNDLLEVAPQIRNKKMLIRQALREYLASESLDLATIGQLSQINKNLEEANTTKDSIRENRASNYAKDRQLREERERERLDREKDREEARRQSDIANKFRQADMALQKKHLQQQADAQRDAKEMQKRRDEQDAERERHREEREDARERRRDAREDAQNLSYRQRAWDAARDNAYANYLRDIDNYNQDQRDRVDAEVKKQDDVSARRVKEVRDLYFGWKPPKSITPSNPCKPWLDSRNPFAKLYKNTNASHAAGLVYDTASNRWINRVTPTPSLKVKPSKQRFTSSIPDSFESLFGTRPTI